MKRFLRMAVCAAVVAAGAGLARGETTLTIHADQAGPAVSKTLYGAFFEEINRAGDGGLYAEMVQNRSFEDAHEPVGWTLMKPDGAEAAWSLDKTRAINDKNPTSLRLEIKNAGGGRVGIVSEGFKGVAMAGKQNTEAALKAWLPRFAAAAAKSKNGLWVRAGERYVLSMYVRGEGAAAKAITASLETQGGAVLAREKIAGVAGEWKKVEMTLAATGADTNARLVISADAAGTVFFDMVSLFPAETFKGRANGLRKDLAEMLAAMEPGSMRFPGGSFMEGETLSQAWHWKPTVGDVAARPGFWQIWGYRSSDGLGYHEYLQMCEDLKSEPLLVVNCGMAEKEFVPVGQLGPWVQEAVDAIEYANGPVESTYGALRAKHGHPAPFNLKYVEIGNENGLSLSWGGGNKQQYKERYVPFYEAIKAKYPGVTTIANVPLDAPVEMVDEHYYNGSEWFLENAGKYDGYDRRGPKIYVGEYAVRADAGNGNLRAALAEAAFMTGMERNSDVVTMSCYAPLLVNVEWRRWNPNAIVFNNAQAYGTPSYHAQAMFAANRADVVLPLEMNGAPAPAAGKKYGVLYAVAGRRGGEVILKVVNCGAEAQAVTVDVAGGKGLTGKGSAVVMRGEKPEAENSFAAPDTVWAVTTEVTVAGSAFRWEVPAYSVTVLRLGEK